MPRAPVASHGNVRKGPEDVKGLQSSFEARAPNSVEQVLS